MDYCPVFLRKIRAFVDKRDGITIVEMLIVIAFLAVLAVVVLVALKPQTQLQKSRDASRKADLQKLKNVLEDYYNDKNSYPATLTCGASLVPYLDKIPCDPLTKTSYAYAGDSTSYWIYVNLEFEEDPVIVKAGCQDGCGPGCAYNYGVSSSNVGLGSCGPGGCSGSWWACQGTYCNNYGPTKPPCPAGGQSYCGDSSCGGGCATQQPCSP